MSNLSYRSSIIADLFVSLKNKFFLTKSFSKKWLIFLIISIFWPFFFLSSLFHPINFIIVGFMSAPFMMIFNPQLIASYGNICAIFLSIVLTWIVIFYLKINKDNKQKLTMFGMFGRTILIGFFLILFFLYFLFILVFRD